MTVPPRGCDPRSVPPHANVSFQRSLVQNPDNEEERIMNTQVVISPRYLIHQMSLLFFLVFLAMPPLKTFALQELYCTSFPLNFSDETKLSEPFATQSQLDLRLEQIKTKYESFTRNLVSQSIYLRRETDLSAESIWLFREDSQALGEMQKWFAKGIDESAWSKQRLPDYRQFTLGWYRTTFSAPTWLTDRIILKFEGIDYSARIFLNERYIG
jgi:hypothetical protein